MLRAVVVRPPKKHDTGVITISEKGDDVNERMNCLDIVAEGRVVRYRRVRYAIRITRRRQPRLIPALLILCVTAVLLALIAEQPGTEISDTVRDVLVALILALSGGAEYVAKALAGLRR